VYLFGSYYTDIKPIIPNSSARASGECTV